MTEKELLAARQSIVQKLTQARLEKGLSQEQLAKRIGTQRSNICRIEKGTQNLSLDLMLKIAEALDKDVSVMLEERSSTMEKVYSLRLYDETLLTFTLEERGLEGLQATILHTETAKQKLFPLDLELTNEGVVKWLERRVIPKNRQFVDEILKTLGLSVNNTKGIIDVCMGLSLNDSYWVVPADFEGKYADYNLYENRFSEALSLVAYTGVGGSREAFSTSPELTTNGMLRKAWRFVEDDGIYLYKGGTEGAANTGNEPYSEYYACQIADKMGIGCVQYDLENWKGILASKCRLFTDIDTSFVPMYGYQMIEELAKQSDHTFELKAGTLYPLLHLLEQKQYLVSYDGETVAGKTRKYYRITDEGKRFLVVRLSEWESYSAAVNKVLSGGVLLAGI